MTEGNFDDFKLPKPVKMDGNIHESKTIFYDLARSRIRYQTWEENIAWQKKYRGSQIGTSATYIIGLKDTVGSDEKVEKWIDKLAIVINKGLIDELGQRLGEDFTSIIPYIIEHELYESWLSAKRGAGQSLEVSNKHILAIRRQYLLATQDGLADKLLRFSIAMNPSTEEECRSAMEYAQRRLQGK
jgi:hypothetical protein